MRFKFGTWFSETIPCPEDEKRFDVFYAQGEVVTNDGEIL
ncbi:hypothetical protein LCGC14_0534280 [marine sediment metagenome]|uniref:Uncharacterized protein n=1 Tax=marine sediment metagenome TaxID=412755 RepID=A0A0F9RZD5_9ZZZZ